MKSEKSVDEKATEYALAVNNAGNVECPACEEDFVWPYRKTDWINGYIAAKEEQDSEASYLRDCNDLMQSAMATDFARIESLRSELAAMKERNEELRKLILIGTENEFRLSKELAAMKEKMEIAMLALAQIDNGRDFLGWIPASNIARDALSKLNSQETKDCK